MDTNQKYILKITNHYRHAEFRIYAREMDSGGTRREEIEREGERDLWFKGVVKKGKMAEWEVENLVRGWCGTLNGDGSVKDGVTVPITIGSDSVPGSTLTTAPLINAHALHFIDDTPAAKPGTFEICVEGDCKPHEGLRVGWARAVPWRVGDGEDEDGDGDGDGDGDEDADKAVDGDWRRRFVPVVTFDAIATSTTTSRGSASTNKHIFTLPTLPIFYIYALPTSIPTAAQIFAHSHSKHPFDPFTVIPGEREGNYMVWKVDFGDESMTGTADEAYVTLSRNGRFRCLYWGEEESGDEKGVEYGVDETDEDDGEDDADVGVRG